MPCYVRLACHLQSAYSSGQVDTIIVILAWAGCLLMPVCVKQPLRWGHTHPAPPLQPAINPNADKHTLLNMQTRDSQLINHAVQAMKQMHGRGWCHGDLRPTRALVSAGGL